MPRRLPPIWPKGSRPANSGRRKGQPNRISVEVRTLASQLLNDPIYQHKLRAAFRSRKLHPTIESLIWQFAIGKPVMPVAIQGAIDVTARLEDERRIFEALDIADLEVLAAESQALVDRALELSRIARGSRPPNAVEPHLSTKSP
jgi:hypothetical protein